MIAVEEEQKYSHSVLSDRTQRKQQHVQDPSGSDHSLITLSDSVYIFLPLANLSNYDRHAAVHEGF